MDSQPQIKSEKSSILVRLLPFFIVMMQRVLGLTCKFKVFGQEHIDALRLQKRPYILSIWHTNVLCSPYLQRGKNVAVLISASRDGDLIAQVVHRFGNTSIRGSTSKGGSAALKAIILHLRKGFPVAFTPDGPRGPALELQGGVIGAAQASGVPIVPFHYECTRQKLAKSWDSHRIPLPFTTFVQSYGEPISIPRQMTPEEFEQKRIEVEKAMLENMQRCIAEKDAIRSGTSHSN